MEDINPEYLAVAFDLKTPTHRHKLYAEYKANRKGMPDELAAQMPILKEILNAMNIFIIEKEGYEADDILGTFAKWGQAQNLDVTILTGDRDSFQLVDKNIKIRMPKTKLGKTEVEVYTKQKILEEYKLKPKDLIEVKGLMGDSSDNIPGVPGVGEKTALSLIQEYKTIDKLYENLDSVKGKLKEKLEQNKELAYISRTLGTIDINVPIEKDLEKIKVEEWNKEEVFTIFKKLKFSRFIERFNLQTNNQNASEINFDFKEITENEEIEKIKDEIYNKKIIFYYIDSKDSNNKTGKIINKEINGIAIFSEKNNIAYYVKDISLFKEIFENKEILKCGYKQKEDYILLKQENINPVNLMFDITIAGYLLNSNITKYDIEYLSNEYLKMDINEYLNNIGINKKDNEQLNLFEQAEVKEDKKERECIYSYIINKLYYVLIKKLEESEVLELFSKIEMPLVEVLADMQFVGIYVDKEEIINFGKELKERIEVLTAEIFELAGENFNINSTKQLR